MRTTGLLEADQLTQAGAAVRSLANVEPIRADYSEEAIPERDPAYRGFEGTLHQEQTVDDVPAEVRRARARQLERFCMSAARAAMVTNL